MKKNPHAVALGRLGRAAMTDAQAAASRANGAKGGRPPSFRRNDLVWFHWKGHLTCSPVLAVHRTTVTIAVSDGERRLAKSRVQKDGDK